MPALGRRTYRLRAVDNGTAGWRETEGTVIENAAYLVTADPARGGTVQVTDKRTGAEVLAGPGNELVIQDEYPQHPRHNEGPWHLAPKGPGLGSASVPATVRRERCDLGSRLVVSFTLDGLDVTQEIVLWDHAERVEFRTHVDSYAGRDRLLRVRFPADVPGGLPVYQTATAVIGRSFGVVDVDSADHWYTLDNPAHQWFGLGSVARVTDRGGLAQAIGVAEVVCPVGPNGLGGSLRDLLVALAAAGVTATCSQADGSRYGAIDVDSNLPDARIALGGPEVNPFTAEVLAAAGPGYAKALATRLAAAPSARLWVPGSRDRADAFGPDADVRGAGDLPVLVLAGDLAAAVADLTGDLADAVVEAGDPVSGEGALKGSVPLADRSVAVLNRGTPGCVVTPDGTLHLSLMRSCSAWPSGIWIDGDRRTAPDGSGFAWQHWSHTFEYALASGPGDWRAAGYSLAAEDYNHDLLTVPGASTGPGTGSGRRAVGGAGHGHARRAQAAREPARRRADRGAGRGGHRHRAAAGDQRPAGHRAGAVPRRRRRVAHRPAGGVRRGTAAGGKRHGICRFAGFRHRNRGAAGWLARSGGHRGGRADRSDLRTLLAAREGPGAGREPAGRGAPVPGQGGPAYPGADPDEAASLTLTVGCGAEAASGTVELVAPDDLTVTASRDLRYDLAPGGYAAWGLSVRVPPGTTPGRYFVAARIRDDLGQLVEDTAMVAVGERLWPDPALPPEDALELMQADYAAGAAEAEVAVLTPGLRLAPGSEGELQVRVTSGLASELRGEAQLVSPFGSWEMLGPWTQGFSVAPGASTVLRFAVHVPMTERHAQWWALVKVMYYGRVRYTEAIPVVIGPVN